MARICAITGKRPVKGNSINRKGQSKKSGGIGTHVTSITKRKFRPNLQRIRIKTANGGTVPQSAGTAFAAITAPGAGSIWDKTAVEARVDSGADQSTLDTTISKSVPLSGRYSLTLQNGYSLTQQGVVPVPGVAARAGRSYETDQSAKFEIADTGTSLVAGQSLSSTDDRWLHTFGAEQKLSDGVTISGSIGETSQGATSKSITAGFKRSW